MQSVLSAAARRNALVAKSYPLVVEPALHRAIERRDREIAPLPFP